MLDCFERLESEGCWVLASRAGSAQPCSAQTKSEGESCSCQRKRKHSTFRQTPALEKRKRWRCVRALPLAWILTRRRSSLPKAPVLPHGPACTGFICKSFLQGLLPKAGFSSQNEEIFCFSPLLQLCLPQALSSVQVGKASA